MQSHSSSTDQLFTPAELASPPLSSTSRASTATTPTYYKPSRASNVTASNTTKASNATNKPPPARVRGGGKARAQQRQEEAAHAALADEEAKRKAAQELKELAEKKAKAVAAFEKQRNQWAASFARYADITSDKVVRLQGVVEVDELADTLTDLKDQLMKPVDFALQHKGVGQRATAFCSYLKANKTQWCADTLTKTNRVYTTLTSRGEFARVSIRPAEHMPEMTFLDLDDVTSISELDARVDLLTAQEDVKRTYLARRAQLTLERENMYVPLLRVADITLARSCGLFECDGIMAMTAWFLVAASGRQPIQLFQQQEQIDLNLVANLIGSAGSTNHCLSTAVARIEAANRTLQHILPHAGSEFTDDIIFQSRAVAVIIAAAQCTSDTALAQLQLTNMVARQPTCMESPMQRIASTGGPWLKESTSKLFTRL